MYWALHKVLRDYNHKQKTKGPTLMELFTAFRSVSSRGNGGTYKYLSVLLARIIAAVKNTDLPMLTHVWQKLEYHIDVCHVTRGAHIKHLYL
jgi:hypothetical protein